jgi:1,4-dihydroxy-2-naphthoate octaprenyltransferase
MGVGEAFVGVNFGALLTLGSYYVQTLTVTPEPLIASIPVSLLITAVLYVNEFPDYNADRLSGKNTLVVRLSRAKAAYGYALIVLSAYAFICLNVVYGVTPQYTLLALIPLPLALEAIRRAFRYHSDYHKLAPANALTIVFHFLTSLLLSCGYLVYGFLATTINVGFYPVMAVVLICTLSTIHFYRKGKGAPG